MRHMTGQPPAPARLLRGSEVCALLNIGKSTLQPWREDGTLEFVELTPPGAARPAYRYPDTQPAIQRVLAALGRCEAPR
jgi:hypothetical protein